MTGPPALIGLCLAGDPGAWEELWGIAAAMVRRASRPLARDRRDDDAEQEFYLFLRADDCRRLRAFRGSAPGELAGYLRVVARNFVRSRLAARRRTEARERMSLRWYAPGEAAGPSEPQVLAALRELLASAPNAGRRHLRELLGPAPAPVGPRTLRRWKASLASACLGGPP